MKSLAVLLALACACRDKHPLVDDGGVAAATGSGSGGSSGSAGSAAADWAALQPFPTIQPERVIAIPTRASIPRFDVGGPAASHGIAVVSSSQFGFIAADYHTGQIAWTKPAGMHVAPPLAFGGGFLLIAECIAPPQVPRDHTLLGCARTVTPTGADQAYIAIHGDAKALAAFALEPGPQSVWPDGNRVVWKRGEQAVLVDPVSGLATPAPSAAEPVVVTYKDKTWSIAHDADHKVVATRGGKVDWQTDHPYAHIIGGIYLPEQTPMLRMVNLGHFRTQPELTVMDIDATGSMHGQVAFPVPGIALVGHAVDAVGDTALAVQLDATLDHHYIAGYAASSLLMWVYPLPRMQRADPIGLAVTPDAVLAFHDGDTLTVLPELSAPPTAPGAARPPSENSTP